MHNQQAITNKKVIQSSLMSTLNGNEFKAILLLCDIYNNQKDIISLKQETIAKHLGADIRTVERVFNKLKKLDLINFERTINGNNYEFTQKFFNLLNESSANLRRMK